MLSHPFSAQRLQVRSESKNGYVKVSIEDNGHGIPPEALGQIFEPNYTTKMQAYNTGMGLGLSIVKRLVEKHQGHISVESKEGNTQFTVMLPSKS